MYNVLIEIQSGEENELCHYSSSEFGGLTKPPFSNIWWLIYIFWWLKPPNHLICRALNISVLRIKLDSHELRSNFKLVGPNLMHRCS